MIGVDSNVLLRYLMRDDEGQFRRAERFFAQRGPTDPAFVSVIVLIEVAWVLGSTFRLPVASVANALRGLLASDELVVQAPDVVRRALRDSDAAGVEFADAVISQLAIDADCDYTVTFDRKAAELPGMVAL